MARPLRMDLVDGWYHVISRGIERRRLYKSAGDFERFIGALADLPSRFGVRVHAHALMPNHYHLLLQTPQANLSQAMQWLNVSYGVWFNHKHRRVGPLFQGRFKAIPVAPDGLHLQVSRYIHLNPVRTQRFELSKDEPAAEGPAPAALVEARVRHLRTYAWSSFAFYAGLKTSPAWLTTGSVLESMGGSAETVRRRAYRSFVEAPLREGVEDAIFDHAMTGVVVGSKAFASAMLARAKGDKARQQALQRQQRDLSWNDIQAAVALAKQEPWDAFCNRRGDPGRDLALLVARRFGRSSLAELGALVGVTYSAIAQAVAKAEKRIAKDRQAAALYVALEKQLNRKSRE